MWQQFFCYSVILQGPSSAQLILAGHIQSDLGLSMLFDARLKPAYSLARVNRALVTNVRIGTRQGCMGLFHIGYIMNTPTDDMNNRIKVS